MTDFCTEKEKSFIMTYTLDYVSTQNNHLPNPKCAEFECVVRIIMRDSEDSKQEYCFSNYDHALRFAYRRYYQSYEKIKRIELLEALSYRLPLIVLEKFELANENLQMTA